MIDRVHKANKADFHRTMTNFELLRIQQPDMEELLLNRDQSCDPSGSDIFLSVDLFDELMVSLAGVYLQLGLHEQTKCTPDPERAVNYHQRHLELLILKESFPINATSERERAIATYSLELKQARLLLLQNQESQLTA